MVPSMPLESMKPMKNLKHRHTKWSVISCHWLVFGTLFMIVFYLSEAIFINRRGMGPEAVVKVLQVRPQVP